MYIALNPPITNVIDLPQRRGGQPGNLLSGRLRGRGDQKDGDSRSGPLRGRETSQEQDPRSDRVRGEVIRRMETRGQDPCEVGRPRKNKRISGQTQGSAPTTVFSLNCPGVRLPRLLMCILLTTHTLFSLVSRPSEVLDRKVSIYVCPNGTMICCGPSTFFIEQCSTAIPATHPLEE